jgi:sugar/nucleoside kinase (ribokinase family)
LPPKHGRRPRLPYFDLLLSLLEQGDANLEVAFGRHVHWGCWPDPGRAMGDAADYAAAAERLSLEVCAAANIADGQTVLDVGCGFGGTIASLNERLRNMRLVGINIEERQLARAKARVTARSDNLVTFVGGSASNLPVTDGSRQLVPVAEVVEPLDATAAGDSFNAAYLAARLSGDAPTAAASAGHRLAALKIRPRGAVMPRSSVPVH